MIIMLFDFVFVVLDAVVGIIVVFVTVAVHRRERIQRWMARRLGSSLVHRPIWMSEFWSSA